MNRRRRGRRARVALLLPIVVGVGILCTALLTLRVRREAPPDLREATSVPADLVGFKTSISYDEARPILDAFRQKLPAELRGKAPVELEASWSRWVARHNAEIRGRLERGDEDSIVNLWLYGTSFTTRPRATRRDIVKLGVGAKDEEILLGRLDDLVAGLASPAANERLRFARQVVERKGIDPATTSGKDQARFYLVQARERVLAENERYRRTLQSANPLEDGAKLTAYSQMYRDRGLSSDTSILVDFSVEQALAAIRSKARLDAGSVRRVAIVGPGLDFTDKAEGYDFYPQQTIQPFAFIDSLIRLELAKPDNLRMTTFDLSPRVNHHLEAARQRASGGEAYVLQLPLDRDDQRRQWHQDLVQYWQRFGDRIGDEVEPIAPPSGAGTVRVRAVRVRPAVVTSIIPQDLNIVLERLEPLAGDERFDLIVATNVLVYYDAFEQALALANVSKMLRPGGFLLTNYVVSPTPPMESSASVITKVYWDRQYNGDTLLWYQRR